MFAMYLISNSSAEKETRLVCLLFEKRFWMLRLPFVVLYLHALPRFRHVFGHDMTLRASVWDCHFVCWADASCAVINQLNTFQKRRGSSSSNSSVVPSLTHVAQELSLLLLLLHYFCVVDCLGDLLYSIKYRSRQKASALREIQAGSLSAGRWEYQTKISCSAATLHPMSSLWSRLFTGGVAIRSWGSQQMLLCIWNTPTFCTTSTNNATKLPTHKSHTAVHMPEKCNSRKYSKNRISLDFAQSSPPRVRGGSVGVLLVSVPKPPFKVKKKIKCCM